MNANVGFLQMQCVQQRSVRKIIKVNNMLNMHNVKEYAENANGLHIVHTQHILYTAQIRHIQNHSSTGCGSRPPCMSVLLLSRSSGGKSNEK